MHLKTARIWIVAAASVLIFKETARAWEANAAFFQVGDNCEVIYASNGASPAPTMFSVVKVGSYPWLLVRTTRLPKRAIGAQSTDEPTPKSDTTKEIWINTNWILTVSFENKAPNK